MIDIQTHQNRFLYYLKCNLKEQAFDCLIQLNERTPICIFSGVIRNFFINSWKIRDLDIVVINKNIDLEEYFKDFKFKKNSFGGYKIDFHGINLDIWFLEDTWVIKKFPDIFTKTPLVYNLPDTPFFNFQSVIYLFDENKFIYNNAFVEFLENRIVDIVFEKNYLSDLCIINSFYYTDTINIQMSDKLAKYLLANYDYYTDYDKIQLKHFGYIPYTKEILNHKILKLTHVKQ